MTERERVDVVREDRYDDRLVLLESGIVNRGRVLSIKAIKNKKVLYTMVQDLSVPFDIEIFFRQIEVASPGRMLQWSLEDIIFKEFMDRWDLVGKFGKRTRNFGIQLFKEETKPLDLDEAIDLAVRNAHLKGRNHLGFKDTLKIIKQTYVWDGVQDFIKDYIDKCGCKEQNERNNRRRGFRNGRRKTSGNDRMVVPSTPRHRSFLSKGRNSTSSEEKVEFEFDVD